VHRPCKSESHHSTYQRFLPCSTPVTHTGKVSGVKPSLRGGVTTRCGGEFVVVQEKLSARHTRERSRGHAHASTHAGHT
jgi:hypothetical protein